MIRGRSSQSGVRTRAWLASAAAAGSAVALAPLAALALTLALGVIAGGCGERRSGGPVPPGALHTLALTNAGPRTAHVFVDGADLGDVAPGATGHFYVRPGLRPVQLRERGEAVREEQGLFAFADGQVVRLTHDPGLPFNLRVVNATGSDLHVSVDLLELGRVRPGATGAWRAPSGHREVHLREAGQTLAASQGRFNLNTTRVVELVHP